MSTKPTDVARWANVGGSITVPPSGKQDVGWVPGEAPPAEYFNWLNNSAYLWFKWLSDGDVSFHNVVATGTLAVTGAATFGSTVGITAALTAASAAFSGAATFASTVGITGAATFGSTVGIAALLTASGGLTLGANTNLTLSGTGDLKHGAREIVVDTSAFAASGNTTFGMPSGGGGAPWSNWGTPPNDTITGPVGLRTGDRILSITYHYSKGGSSAFLTMSLNSRNATTNTTRDTIADVTSGAGFVTLTRSSINYTLASGDAMWLQAQATNAAHRFSHAIIAYDHP